MGRAQRLRLLMRILAKEKHHSSLSESYNEIMKQPVTTMTTRSQTRGIPATFRTNNTQYHNSFLPWTIRDLKSQSEQAISYSANAGLAPTANSIETGHTEPVLINTDQIRLNKLKKMLQQKVKSDNYYGFS